MAEASIDIRVFPNKELTSVDMAEALDAAIINTGVIQGCEVTLINGVLNIGSGRLIVKGRLGVVTGGTIPNPTNLITRQNCWLIAVCDLSNSERPFYFMLATADDLDRLGVVGEEEDPAFNVNGGIEAATLGACEFDPATGLVSNYSSLIQGTPRKGWDWYNELYKKITDLDTYYNSKFTWSTVNADGFRGKTWATIPAGASEAFVEVYTAWDTNQKVSVDFYLPFNSWIYTTASTSRVHANHWGSSWDGVVAVETRIVNGSSYQVRLLHSYKGTNNEAANTSWRVFYR